MWCTYNAVWSQYLYGSVVEECFSWFGGKGVQENVSYGYGSWWLLLTRQWIYKIPPSLVPGMMPCFFLPFRHRGFGAITNASFLALEGDCVVPWKFQYQFIMGNELACVSSIQPNEK